MDRNAKRRKRYAEMPQEKKEDLLRRRREANASFVLFLFQIERAWPGISSLSVLAVLIANTSYLSFRNAWMSLQILDISSSVPSNPH